MKTRYFEKLSQNLVLLSLFTLVGLLPLHANAQTVVSRARLGGYAEDITYVTSGALKDQVVMMNGYELYATPLAKKGVLSKVCKIENPEIDQFATGFTYVESEALFVNRSQRQCSQSERLSIWRI